MAGEEGWYWLSTCPKFLLGEGRVHFHIYRFGNFDVSDHKPRIINQLGHCFWNVLTATHCEKNHLYLCPKHTVHTHWKHVHKIILHEMVYVRNAPWYFLFCFISLFKKSLFNMLKWFWDWPWLGKHPAGDLRLYNTVPKLLFSFHISTMMKCLFMSFIHFLIGLFVVDCSFDCLFYIQVLCLTCDLQIFSALPAVCLFTL